MKAQNNDSGRLKTLGRLARLVGEILDGQEHDRMTAAKLLDTTPANAARHLEAIAANLTQVKERRDGRIRKYYADILASRPTPERPAAIAACFASSLARLLEPSKYGVAMREAVSYVLQAMPDGASFANIERKFFFLRRGGEPAIERTPAILDTIVDALLDGRFVEIEYLRFDSQVIRKRLRPLSIAIYEHQLYLIAHNSRSLPVIYRFARVVDARGQPERFEYPQSSVYDPEVLFRSQFGIIVNEDVPIASIVVKLSPKWKTYVDGHRWHPSQRTTIDGEHVIVHLDVRVCDELKRWILGFGPEAEVLEPASLRDELGASLRRTAELYGPEPAPAKRRKVSRSTDSPAKKGAASRATRPPRRAPSAGKTRPR